MWQQLGFLVGTGKQLQMNRMGVPHEEEGGGAETRVNVVPELPLLEARLDAPSLRTSDAEQTQVSQSIRTHVSQSIKTQVSQSIKTQVSQSVKAQVSQSIKTQVSQWITTRLLQQLKGCSLDMRVNLGLSVFISISPACGSSPAQVQCMITCTKTCSNQNV